MGARVKSYSHFVKIYPYQNRQKFPSSQAAVDFVKQHIQNYPLAKLDYIEIRHAHTLEVLDDLAEENHPHAFMAAFLGKTRLIDNLPLC